MEVAAPAAPVAPAPSGGSSAAPVKPNPVIPSNKGGATNAAPAGTKPAAPAPQPTTPQRHKWTDKVDGKEVEFEASDEDLRGAFRQRNAAEQRFKQAAQDRKEVAAERARNEQTLARISDRKQMLKAFKEANPSVDMTQFLAEELQTLLTEEEQLQDPNIRERRRLEQENEGFRTEKQQAAELAQQQEQDRQVGVETERIAGKFKEALSLLKLPVNDLTVKLMAEAEFTKRQQGWDLSPAQLATSVQKAMSAQVEAMVMGDDDDSAFDPADLATSAESDKRILGAFPQLTGRIHRAIVREFKRRQAGGAGQQPAGVQPQRLRREPIEQPAKPRTLTSAEEHKAYGGAGRTLRTI